MINYKMENINNRPGIYQDALSLGSDLICVFFQQNFKVTLHHLPVLAH